MEILYIWSDILQSNTLLKCINGRFYCRSMRNIRRHDFKDASSWLVLWMKNDSSSIWKRGEHAMLSKQQIRKENNMTFCSAQCDQFYSWNQVNIEFFIIKFQIKKVILPNLKLITYTLSKSIFANSWLNWYLPNSEVAHFTSSLSEFADNPKFCTKVCFRNIAPPLPKTNCKKPGEAPEETFWIQ